MTRHLRLAVATLGYLGLVVSIGQAQNAATPPEPVKGPLQVDTQSSRAYIKVGSATRFGHDHGVLGMLRGGTVDFAAGGDLTFDMRTFIADRPEARTYVGLTKAISASDAQKTTTTMLGKDVLNVAQFPTARYSYKVAKPLDGQRPGQPGNYQLDGFFTVHGNTKNQPLRAVLEATDQPGVYRFRCAFAILQTQYGMTPYSAIGGLVGVTDQLDIYGQLLLRPAPAANATAGANTPGETR